MHQQKSFGTGDEIRILLRVKVIKSGWFCVTKRETDTNTLTTIGK